MLSHFRTSMSLLELVSNPVHWVLGWSENVFLRNETIFRGTCGYPQCFNFAVSFFFLFFFRITGREMFQRSKIIQTSGLEPNLRSSDGRLVGVGSGGSTSRRRQRLQVGTACPLGNVGVRLPAQTQPLQQFWANWPS